MGVREGDALDDDIDGVAGGAPHGGALDGTRDDGVRGDERGGSEDSVIEDDAVHGTVDTIGEVELELGFEKGLLGAIVSLEGDGDHAFALGDDGAGKGSGLGAEEATGFGDDADVGREEGISDGSDFRANDGEGQIAGLDTGEAASNVDEVHVETVVSGGIEDLASELEGLDPSDRGEATGADVEGDTDEGHSVLLALGDERGGLGEGSAEFGAEGHERVRVVGQETKDETGLGEVLADLLQLKGVVEGHHSDTLLLGIEDVLNLLAGVGKDDVLNVDARKAQNLLQFHL